MRRKLILNPLGRKGQAAKLGGLYLDLLRPGTSHIELALTEGPGHTTELAKEALLDGFDHLVAIGGDGTLNELVNGYFKDQKPINPDAALSILAQGTGCDFIRNYGLKPLLEEQVKRIHRGDRHRCDVGLVQFKNAQGGDETRYFINVGGFGLAGHVSGLVHRHKKNFFSAKTSFMTASLEGMLTYSNPKVSLSLDGQRPMELKIKTVALANGQFFGGGMWIAPGAALDDGRMELVILSDFNLLQSLQNFPKIYKGTHLKVPGVFRYSVKTLEATSTERVPLDLDGEAPGFLPARFEVLPTQVLLII